MDGDPRGNPAHLRSWTRQTGVDSGDFELLVGHGGAGLAVVESIRKELRPGDRLFQVEAPERIMAEMGVYAEGGKLARGSWVLFTEDHVVAEPGCLAGVFEAIHSQPDAPGFFLACGHIGHEPLARYEALMYDEMVPYWRSENSWERVRIRATVIRRDLLEAAGWVNAHYGLFGETVLSLRLWHAGHRLRFLPTARIRHRNTATARLMIQHVSDFAMGEMAFRREARSEDLALLATGEVPLWEPLLDKETAAMVAADGGDGQGSRIAAKVARFGARAFVFARKRKRDINLLRFYASSGDQAKGLDGLKQFWSSIAVAAQWEWALRNRLEPVAIDGGEPWPIGSYFGFHPPETAGSGERFRWSATTAGVFFDPPPESNRVVLKTPGLLPGLKELPLRLFLNGRELPPDRVKRGWDKVIIKVHRRDMRPGGLQLLHWRVARHDNPADPRELGLPVSGVSLESRQSTPVTVPSS